MNIGWLGLGRLGMPCALALAKAGHTVHGYDPADRIFEAWVNRTWPHDEPGVEALMQRTSMRLTPYLTHAVDRADVVFVAVQTPHGPGYGGEVPVPARLAPFDTTFLTAAVEEVARHAAPGAPIVVVSTVLPGTCAKVVEPLLDGRPLIYSPAFVAMGSVLADLERPEFVLAGVRDKAHAETLREVYAHVDAPLMVAGVESAELAKMAYNTVIGAKIVLANAWGELADATGADVDEVSSVLEAATDRVASPRYLRAGMGDGGPCHGRDQTAMAWLALEHGLSADPFGFMVRAREAQAAALADTAMRLARNHGLPIVVVGRAYKPGVSITDGSAALLVGHYIEEWGDGVAWLDPACGHPGPVTDPAVFVVALPDRQPERYPPGSVVVDPWGVVPDDAAETVVRIGRR